MSNIKQPIWFTLGGRDRGQGKRKQIPFSGFYKKVIETPWEDVSTPWTKYLKAHPDEKAKLKAMPGWFKGATYEGDKRNVHGIEAIYLLQLDIDYATPAKAAELKDMTVPIGRYLLAVYTTRSHTPENPRMRVLIPLRRGVSPDEANALARYVSMELDDDPQAGIDLCDPVSFRNNQISYYPSISKGQPYWSILHDGEVLDPDAYLAEHPGWEDITNLPLQSDEDGLREYDPNRKPEDPREKDGLIGGWCRNYDVYAVRDMLEDVYEDGDPGPSEEDRWSYVAGASSNGVIVYGDGLFIYSHHATDPCGEKLCNAWDMYRLHEFGHLDDKVRLGTPLNQLPSQKAMEKHALADPAVKAEVIRGRADAFDDYDDDEDVDGYEPGEESPEPEQDEDDEFDFGLEDDTSEEDDDPFGLDETPDRPKSDKKTRKKKKAPEIPWEARLRTNKDGKIEANIYNSTLLSENVPGVAGRLGYNEHTRMPVVFKPIGKKGISSASGPIPKKGFREVQDADDHSVAIIYSAPKSVGGYEVDFSKIDILRGMAIAGRQKAFHPIKDKIEECHKLYLESGKATKGDIYQMPQKWLGCPDTPMHRESSYALLLGMIARIYEPGCKYDLVVILRGPQGGRKSTFWKVLSMDNTSNLGKNFSDIGRMIEAMQGAWISEMAEMSGFRRETVNEAKDFITRETDKFRLAYGTRAEEYPRQTVLVSTTNETEVLHDPTGNRRFIIWITHADEDNPLDLEGFEQAVPMLIGEAYDEYLRLREADPYSPLWLDLRSKEARKERDRLADEARAKTAAENLAEVVQEYLDRRVPVGELLMKQDEDNQITDPRITDLPDDTLVWRNRVHARTVFADLENTPDLRQFRDATVNLMGRAIDGLEGWAKHQRYRVSPGASATNWYSRIGGPGVGGPEWIPAPEEPDDDDIDLGDLG